MKEEDYNPMPASLNHYNFLAAKKKAVLEEDIKNEPVPFPVYRKCENIRNDRNWRNLLRSTLQESKKLINELRP